MSNAFCSKTVHIMSLFVTISFSPIKVYIALLSQTKQDLRTKIV